MARIIKAGPGDDLREMARQMAPNLREGDRLEVERGLGCTALEGLEFSLRASRNVFRIEHEGLPVAMGGATPVPWNPRVGQPWMLGTDFITTHSNWFLRNTPEIWETVEHQYDWLWNMTDAKNTVHLRWLEWSGCRFIGWWLLNDNPFIEFSKQCAAH